MIVGFGDTDITNKEASMNKNIEQALKLVPVSKPKDFNPVVMRRNRLLQAIRKQIVLWLKFKAGERTNRLWFWFNEDGQIFLQIKYGKTPLELGKGKYAIQCNTIDEVGTNLGIAESLVIKGEFDHLLTAISKEIRAKFKKRPPTT
jgi:hypothetical protein